MLQHDAIWAGFDNLARERKISSSRMAQIAGFSPGAFNKCKRYKSNGLPHWPSSQTLVRILNTMDVSWIDFVNYFPENQK